MPTETVEKASLTATAHRTSFFRQSGWLMFATVAGGVFMTAMHFLSKAIPVSEYGQFGVFLSVAMFVPAAPLQMVLAQQTAQAIALHREHELSSLIRAAWLTTFVLWLVAAVVVLLFQGPIMAQWKISNPAAIWLTFESPQTLTGRLLKPPDSLLSPNWPSVLSPQANRVPSEHNAKLWFVPAVIATTVFPKSAETPGEAFTAVGTLR